MKIIIILSIILIVTNYIYHAFYYDTHKKDLAMFIFDQLVLFFTSGLGVLALLKAYVYKNHQEIISEAMFLVWKNKLYEHEVFNAMQLYNDNLEQIGYITKNKGRLLLLKDILKFEVLYLSLFLSTSIQWIISNKKRSNLEYVSKFIIESFNEYTREVVNSFQDEDIDQQIINVYLNHKKTFVEPVKKFIETKSTNTRLPTFLYLIHIIDVINVSANVFLGGLVVDIDSMNGELKDVVYKGEHL